MSSSNPAPATKTYRAEDFARYLDTGRNVALVPTNLHQSANQKPPERVEPREMEDLGVELPEPLRELIEQGDDPSNPIGSTDAHFKSRSHAVFGLACQLAKLGVPEKLIAGILLNPRYKISAHVLERPNSKEYAWRQAVRARLAVETNFYDVNKDGTPKKTLRNTICAVIKLGLVCRYDQFRNRMTISGHTIQHYTGEVSDKACTMVRDRIIEEFNFDPGRQNVLDGVSTLALKNPFNPVRDYLLNLKWDGVPRLANLFRDYFEADDTALNRFAGQMLLVAGVRRILSPGVKYDIMVVIEGPQGSGKSTALRVLASNDFFSDQSILSRDDKTQMEAVEGIWIFEVAELDGMNRTETSRIKAFITRQVDRARRAYAHFAESWPRQVIFVGTTNERFYLKDTTGNRRFLPIKTDAIDVTALAADRDQLWAEAVHLEAQGFPIHVPDELLAEAVEAQSERTQDDPWLDVLSVVKGEVVGDEERVFTETLYGEDYLNIPPAIRQSYHPKRIAENMRELGWEGPQRIRIGNRSLQGYRRPATHDGHELF